MGIITSLLRLVGCRGNSISGSTHDEQFSAGQVWRYKTRDGESESRVIVGKVESWEKLGTIVHIKVTGISVKSPMTPDGFVTFLGHEPITETKLKESVTTLTREKADLSGFNEGYGAWLDAFQKGRAGVYTITVKETIDCMEEVLARGTPSTQTR